MSTHAVRVIRIQQVLPHPNADKLDIIPIPGSAWQCVSQKGAFKPGDLAVYIEPDYVVPTDRPEFAFLAKEGNNNKHRLKAIKLRGALSFGLLIPFSPDEQSPTIDMDTNRPVTEWVGMNMMRALGIERYVPIEDVRLGADTLPGPSPIAPKFDMENLSNYPDIFLPGEHVVVTEKIHGTNARYLYQNGVFYIGSRTRWLKDGTHVWARVAKSNPGIQRWCTVHEGTVLYGEIFGPVQSLRYGQKNPTFRAFAIYEPPGVWTMPNDLPLFSIKTVPLLYVGPFDFARIWPIAETDSSVEGAEVGHMMEGLVIQPCVPRVDPNVGRVIVKHISQRYWLSNHG